MERKSYVILTDQQNLLPFLVEFHFDRGSEFGEIAKSFSSFLGDQVVKVNLSNSMLLGKAESTLATEQYMVRLKHIQGYNTLCVRKVT